MIMMGSYQRHLREQAARGSAIKQRRANGMWVVTYIATGGFRAFNTFATEAAAGEFADGLPMGALPDILQPITNPAEKAAVRGRDQSEDYTR
jgi:hypothetical protein